MAQMILIMYLKKKIKIFYQEKEAMDIGFGSHILY
jgi:hypothetical protein